MSNPHIVLGVAKTATPEEIKSAYRRLVKEYHPDRNPDDEKAKARFLEIQQAYEALTKPQPQPHMHTRGPAAGFDFRSMHTVMQVQCQITLEQAFAGCDVSLNIATPGGNKTVMVTLPPGVMSGMQMRVNNPDIDFGNTIIIVVVIVEPLPNLEAQGANLIGRIAIDALDAMLGGTINFSSLDGAHTVSYPAGMQAGGYVRLAGLGMPRVDVSGSRGDLVVVFDVAMPTLTSPEQIAAAEALRALLRPA